VSGYLLRVLQKTYSQESRRGNIFSDRPVIDDLPINKTGGKSLPLLGEIGMTCVAQVSENILTMTVQKYGYGSVNLGRIS
jgi:hypothetical protein